VTTNKLAVMASTVKQESLGKSATAFLAGQKGF